MRISGRSSMVGARRNRKIGAPPGSAAGRSEIDPLFTYIWRNSRGEQLSILLIVVISMPFYYVSLDLPKLIVNDAIQGRAFQNGKTETIFLNLHLNLPFFGDSEIFRGVLLSRENYLFALSGAFLALVLINGAFKYVINMRKGKLGERLLRGLRLDLFSLLLRFKPEAIRNVKASEVATIIKDEVEPIGAFVGDAFIQPVFLAGQALTALAFILMQSPSLGILAGAMVLVQGLVIPRMRREQIRLGKERQIRSRSLAGRIGEVVDAKAEVDNHGTSGYERMQISAMLDHLFRIRFELFSRKFMVKFLNNLLAQITPFLFYSIGGYYALKGSLDIGQLVAVIAAYRDLPPPVKELIDWDQQRLDVDVKYEQIVEQFSGGDLAPVESAPLGALGSGTIDIRGLRIAGAGGDMLLDGVNVSIALGSHTAVTGQMGDGASVLAQVIGRRLTVYSGSVRIAGHDLAVLSSSALGPRVAYVGAEPIIFDGTIRHNILYGLKRPPYAAQPGSGLAIPGEDWTDYTAAGASGQEDLDERIVDALATVGFADAIYRFGLGRRIDPEGDPSIAARFVKARLALNEALIADNAKGLIEPFDPERFNRNSSIGENLLFGVTEGDGFSDTRLADHPFVRAILDAEGLTDALTGMGLKIAATMVEIFAGLSSDHFLFEQFSFISMSDLPAYAEIVGRIHAPGETVEDVDRIRLIALSLRYVEPRHRLGLLTPELIERILRARGRFMTSLPADMKGAVEFYDPNRFCAAAPLRDNLLFGRIAYGLPGATDRVLAAVRSIVRDCGLEQEIYRLGLDHQVGPGGRLLFAPQRAAIVLVRSLIKRPDVLVLNQPFSAFSDSEGSAMLDRIKERMAGKTLIVMTRDPVTAARFDAVVEFDGPKVKSAGPAARPSPEARPAESTPPHGLTEQAELQSLRTIPMFASVDTARLKLISFTSERLSFRSGEVIFRQGTPSDSVFVLLDGTAEVVLETPSGSRHLSKIGGNSVIGEMGVLTGEVRSATVVADTDLSALRLSKDLFLGLITEFPQISLALMREQIKRVVKAEARWVQGADAV